MPRTQRSLLIPAAKIAVTGSSFGCHDLLAGVLGEVSEGREILQFGALIPSRRTQLRPIPDALPRN